MKKERKKKARSLFVVVVSVCDVNTRNVHDVTGVLQIDRATLERSVIFDHDVTVFGGACRDETGLCGVGRQEAFVGEIVRAVMAVQVRLLSERAPTHAAVEGALLVVNVADVTLQVGRDAEGALAELALVRLLARVRAHVACEVCRAREVLAAEVADELVF